FTPGFDGAGIIDAVGEGVKEFKPGDRVAYTGHLGTYAEASVVPASKLIPLPSDLSFEQGAAFPHQGMTAHYLIHEYRSLKPGDTVLIHAAAGGLGLLVVQWAKRLGARVIGSVSTEEKAQAARAAGADEVILYIRQDFVAETKRLTHGLGADLIIDGVGKTTFTGNLEAAAVRGHVVIHGFADGLPDPIQPVSLLCARSRSQAGCSPISHARAKNCCGAQTMCSTGFARARSGCTLIRCFRWRKRWKRNEDWKTANPPARSSCRQRHNPDAMKISSGHRIFNRGAGEERPRAQRIARLPDTQRRYDHDTKNRFNTR